MHSLHALNRFSKGLFPLQHYKRRKKLTLLTPIHFPSVPIPTFPARLLNTATHRHSSFYYIVRASIIPYSASAQKRRHLHFTKRFGMEKDQAQAQGF
jgi:hypothetical protein